MKILHIAPFNTSGMPIAMVRAERELGHNSRLITLAYDKRGYEEDICLNLPFLDFWGTRLVKRLVSARDKLKVNNLARIPGKIPIQWQPANPVEKALVRLREKIWQPRLNALIKTHDLLSFDVYQLDGGMEFYRDGTFLTQVKKKGAKIICCYTGSDLRTRGVIPAIDAMVDLNVTLEFDHLRLHPGIYHIFFPFDVSRFQIAGNRQRKKLKIGHAPTVRSAKGSHIIIPILQKLAEHYDIEIVLIENMPYAAAIHAKSECDIFIDQIGDLGYGINSLEALAMGIPTCSCLAPGFADQYPAHPFIAINAENLEIQLIRLITDETYRQKKAIAGRPWVEQYHNPLKSVWRIHTLLGITEPQTERAS